VLGAVYGRAEVTEAAQSLCPDKASLPCSLQASNSVFGDNWVGTVKDFVVVYVYKGKVYADRTRENGVVTIPNDSCTDKCTVHEIEYDYDGTILPIKINTYGSYEVGEPNYTYYSADNSDCCSANNGNSRVCGDCTEYIDVMNSNWQDNWYGTVKSYSQIELETSIITYHHVHFFYFTTCVQVSTEYTKGLPLNCEVQGNVTPFIQPYYDFSRW
jgi:hypothetical protein